MLRLSLSPAATALGLAVDHNGFGDEERSRRRNFVSVSS
jgi:hypothetical protein